MPQAIVPSTEVAKPKVVAVKKPKQKETCFVIMPFGGWGDEYYETIYCPAINSAGLEPHRADDLFRPSTIVHDIWAYTRKAKILLADLTGKNPNVFYELGLAHALAKPVILVAESMEEIPFDFRSLRVITYDKHDPEWGPILREKVAASIKEVLKSPIEAVLPAFLEVKRSELKPTVTRHEKEMIEIKQELDFLRREVRSRIMPDDIMDARRIRSEEEARDFLHRYLELGMPLDHITRRLEAMGVPAGWIRERLRDYGRAPHVSRGRAVRRSIRKAK